jgi:flagellar biogenesis protein FliO
MQRIIINLVCFMSLMKSASLLHAQNNWQAPNTRAANVGDRPQTQATPSRSNPQVTSPANLQPQANPRLDRSAVIPASRQEVLSQNTLTPAHSITNPAESARVRLPKSDSKATTQVTSTGSGWKSLVTTLSALLLVIGIFVGFAVLTRRAWSPARSTLPKQAFEILGRSTLGPRQQVLLMRFGNKVLLVNQELGNVQTLSEIDDPAEVDRLVGLCEQSTPNSLSTNFGSVLSQVINGGTASNFKRSFFSRPAASRGEAV